MKRLALVTVFFTLTFSALAIADQKYNPYTNKWETTDSDSTLQYNALEDEWGYADENANPRYNALQDQW